MFGNSYFFNILVKYVSGLVYAFKETLIKNFTEISL